MHEKQTIPEWLVRVFMLAILVISSASAGLAEGVAWLERDAQNGFATATTPQVGDVVSGVGLNPFTWPPERPIWGHLSVPDWRESDLRESTVRTLATLSSLGAGDTYPDPLRGNVSLLAEIRAQHDHLEGGAVLAWHLWGLRAAGVLEDDPLRLEDESRLAVLQRTDGSVPCSPNYGVPSVDCTAWALLALQGRNATFEERAASFLRSHQHGNGGFGEDKPNLQATVWAAAALGDGPSSEAGQFILGLQADNGKFHCIDLQTPCGHAWATAEAVAFLAESYPLQHRPPPTIDGPSTLREGEMGTLRADQNVTWHVGEDFIQAVDLERAFSASQTIYAQTSEGGWAQWHVHVIPDSAPAPALPFWFAMGLLGWASHRSKQRTIH